ncbi:Putative AAA+ ATPase domain, ATPase, AAA-type, core [Septoria linicola]|uniref:AAA+ ATPase domain, ATPase, AAA-type, core n=1 Tax=Septoria linicola TaxID=215465 RepID=A0A9Q9EM58_9PEZI|nr:Putative AAA+ ATPase domain, ATPase, AAA-type, core [Septoria linicola]
MRDSTYDGFGGEELVVSCAGFSSDPIKQFIESCREAADQRKQFYVIIYGRDRYGMGWKPRLRRPLRRLDTVHFDDEVKQALINDIRTYLDPRTQKLYQSRSMPYRRGYLFHGPPGSGKSSLSTAIAGEFALDLYEVKIPSIASDSDLEQMFSEVPPRSIVLLEDIDAVWTGRDRQLVDSDDDGSNTSNVTLSGLLNVLDGVGSQEGRIVIMTTNRLDELDSALIRPGRVDFKVYLGHISRQSAHDMFVRMFAPDLLSWAAHMVSATPDTLDDHISLEQVKMLATQFSQEVPEGRFTPSQLQGFFQQHLNSAVRAASSVAAWVRQQESGNPEKGFEIC